MQKKSLERLDQILKILNSYDFALTLRQIYYQLITRQIIPQPVDGDEAKRVYKRLSNLCVNGRDEGILPEEAFIDNLRILDKPGAWVDLNSFKETVRRSYNKDKWQNQPKYLEIWTEKDTLRSVLTKITYPYDVGLLVVRGQDSRTEIYRASQRYKAKADKECYLYYCGDFDPSGLSIYNSIKNRLNVFGVSINYKRLALTPEQIKAYSLPSESGKKNDPNYNKFVALYGDDKVVELDSLPPDILRDIVKEAITKNIDYELLGLVQEREVEEQTKLNKFIDKGI